MKIIFFIITFLTVCNFVVAQSGCTDFLANNYNSAAITNDGSCTYNAASIAPLSSIALSSSIDETSGLIEWDNYFYTHNDDTDNKIYKLDKITGAIQQNYPLNAIQNTDWEEISQDADYIYVGDFGNNVSGNRTNLKIYKILKSSLSNTPVIETISFLYANQTDFTAQAANQTNFDCEAFVVTNNEILLFTKQWTSNQTGIYSLPKMPGSYVANLLTSINVSGLITGATLKENSRLIALSGYSNNLQPFIYLIYDFQGLDFSIANKRKLDISLSFHQIESISTIDGIEYYLTNEAFSYGVFINNPQKLHHFSLNSYLNNYLTNLSTNDNIIDVIKTIYPNPTEGLLYLDNFENMRYKILDSNSRTLKSGKIVDKKIDISNFQNGIYYLKINDNQEVVKIIKK